MAEAEGLKSVRGRQPLELVHGTRGVMGVTGRIGLMTVTAG